MGVLAATGYAQGRTDYLLRMLRENSEYRVRVTAANTLGGVGDPTAVPGLIQALRDEHPAVRAAAAAALGRLADPQALPALESLSNDPVADVRVQAQRSTRRLAEIARRAPPPPPPPTAAGGRYYVGIGGMGNQSGVRTAELPRLMREFVVQALEQAPDVVLAPDGLSPRDVERALEQGSMTGFFIDGSVTRLARTPEGVRAEVNIMVMSNPGRDLRSILRGGATVSTDSNLSPQLELQTQDQALQAAVGGAFRRLTKVMAALSGP